MRITVFTPTYNRGYIIKKLYRSLQRQTFRDFEWIVIDDGSTDNTQELFEGFMMESNDFPIRYEKVENGGKHRAINRGVKMAQGEMFYIVDSDDYLPDRALEIVDKYENSIPKNEKDRFCGVCGKRGHPDGTELGLSFSGEILDITVLERPAHGILGDKAEVYYTGMMKQYVFPEFPGENFLTECIVWDRMGADGYKIRFFNTVVLICDYLEDGLTAQGMRLFESNPKGYALYLRQSAQFGKISGRVKWNKYLDYFYLMRKQQSFAITASELNENPITLWIRLLIMRVDRKYNIKRNL